MKKTRAITPCAPFLSVLILAMLGSYWEKNIAQNTFMKVIVKRWFKHDIKGNMVDIRYIPHVPVSVFR